MSLLDLKRHFVDEIPSAFYRASIFLEFSNFLTYLTAQLNTGISVWIDGSFVTSKELPGDLDIVVLADYDELQNAKEALEDILSHHKRLFKKLDFYFIPTCRPDHHYFTKSEAIKRYWQNLFTFSKENEDLRRLPKGVVQIDLK